MNANLPIPDLYTFACTHCHSELRVPISMEGVSGPCPCCGEEIIAPQRNAVVVEKPRAVAQKREATEPQEEETPTEGERTRGIAWFEKRSFRPIRMMLAVGSCALIFASFESLKTRRWVWQSPAENPVVQTVLTPTAPRQSAPAASSPAAPVVPPPSLPDLSRLSAER